MTFIIKYWYLWIFIILVFLLDLIMPKLKEFLGEKSVENYLAMLDKSKYKTINNLMIEIDNTTVHIDHIVISNYGIFVIEKKDYKGKISGDEHDETWKQTIHIKREELNNPILDNHERIEVLKQILQEFGHLKFISIIAFTTNSELKVTANTDVVYTIHLIDTIKKYTEETISDNKREIVYSKLLSQNP